MWLRWRKGNGMKTEFSISSFLFYTLEVSFHGRTHQRGDSRRWKSELFVTAPKERRVPSRATPGLAPWDRVANWNSEGWFLHGKLSGFTKFVRAPWGLDNLNISLSPFSCGVNFMCQPDWAQIFELTLLWVFLWECFETFSMF